MIKNVEINREQVLKTFQDYTNDYDAADPKIKLKIDHTYRVAGLCQQIAQSLDLTKMEVDFAWLLGMLHDVGRFEQLRRFGTFVDAQSIDHAQFGADILFLEEHRIRDYIVDSANDDLIEKAIRNHSAYRIENGLSEYEAMFCNILRDADKIDILKVNVDVPLEDIYNVTTEDLRSCLVSKPVMDNFYQHQATLRALKETAVDNVVGHISLMFELVYPMSYKLVKEQGYLDQLMAFESKNPETNKQFEALRDEMNAYIAKQIAKA